MWIKPNIVRGFLRVWEERLQLPITAGKGQWLGTPVTVFLWRNIVDSYALESNPMGGFELCREHSVARLTAVY